MPPKLFFRPCPFLVNRHVQTILAAHLQMTTEPPAATQHVHLPDGDRIALEVSTPEHWQPYAATVVLVHGLTGCHLSPYMVRMARKLWDNGIRAVRMNMRGCGSGHGLARQPYHSGRSEDVLAVLQYLRHTTPLSPLTAIGFSLGGNLILKLAAELQTTAADYLSQVIAVCPSADLSACVQMLARASNRLYERYFVRRLKADVAVRHTLFPDLPPVSLPDRLSLYAFDTLYTAPRCGFRDADDYYARCSAAPLVPQITVPCRILFAADDPFIDTTVFDGLLMPPNIEVWRTDRGGHLGFLGHPGHPGGYRWLDTQLLAWCQQPTPRQRAQIHRVHHPR